MACQKYKLIRSTQKTIFISARIMIIIYFTLKKILENDEKKGKGQIKSKQRNNQTIRIEFNLIQFQFNLIQNNQVLMKITRN